MLSPLPSNINSVSDQARLKTNPPTEVNLGLPQDIAYLFPANYSYLVVEHSKKEQDAFLGAESHSFTLTVWTNANTPQAAVQWIEDFEKISTVRHCHHQQKKLTETQEKMKFQIPSSRMFKSTRMKKTECPSTLRVRVYSSLALAIANHPSKACLIDMQYSHNHPVNSAHALSCRPVANCAKEEYNSLFES